MGRGRQKAKQTKVARQLKYTSFEPNYQALERELNGSSHSDFAPHSDFDSEDAEYDDTNDPYSDWSDKS